MDKNTYFFHLRASHRRRKNQIKELQRPDEQTTSDLLEMEGLTNDFFQHLYTSEGVNNMHQVLDTVPTRVTPEMNAMLNALYSQEEVKPALFQMFPLKAPGPDGFTGRIYATWWTIIRGDFMRAL